MFCPKCGTENQEDARFCASCGGPLGGESSASEQGDTAKPEFEASIDSHKNNQGAQVTTINVQAPAQVTRNGIGTAGFVLALIGVFLSWIPIVGWIIWALGALLSVIGVFRKPKGLAIAGVCCSFIDLILLLFVVASCSAAGGLLAFS